jgi:hypothetical protein
MIMKKIRSIILAGLALAVIFGASAGLAQSTPPVTPAPHNGTAGLPADIKALITSFDATRDAYLASQGALLTKLSAATTAAEREAIRDQLQANRTAFLTELKAFRSDLKTDIAALKGKITHAELLRIIDAAYRAATEGGPNHHKGH